MSEKLKDYQVLDVLCDGTFYKVKHKVTSNIFAWKACDCSAYSDEQIQNIVNEVKTIKKVTSGNLLRYHDTILHHASRTLYFVLEYNSWRSVQELFHVGRAANKYFSETFIWHLLLVLAKTCKVVENFNFAVIRKCITPSTIYISEGEGVRVDCFQLQVKSPGPTDLLRQAGQVIHSLCYQQLTSEDDIKEFHYSDDLREVVSFVTDDRSASLHPEVIIYHPTVLSNIEGKLQPKHLSEILVPSGYHVKKSELNKCDSEKVDEMCKSIKPLPRRQLNIVESPIYANVSPKQKLDKAIETFDKQKGSLSPTLAALALELPGYVPRSRRPYNETLDPYNTAQQVSEQTLSRQWVSRLIALRYREDSLNKRERDLVVKEIMHSPIKYVFQEDTDVCKSNGITLPPVVASAEKNRRSSRCRRRRSRLGRTRKRRQGCSYEDLEGSLSADTSDGSIIITATKFTMENLPHHNIFSDLSSRKVQSIPSNPFVGSDESMSLTFCDLDNIDSERENVYKTVKDITKFKYLDSGNTTDGKTSKLWSHSSPCKHGKVYTNITNQGSLKKTPSKCSSTSRSSMTSRCSMMSARSHWSTESSNSKVNEGYVSDWTCSSIKHFPQTPTAPSDLKKVKSRKSILNFKTPFKFKSSSKV